MKKKVLGIILSAAMAASLIYIGVNVLLNCSCVVYCAEAVYNYRASREGNTWTALTEHSSLRHAKSAYETSLAIWELLKEAGEPAQNNALQRVLVYQRRLIRTTIGLRDRSAYKDSARDYWTRMRRWWREDRSRTGFLWACKQIAYRVLRL